MDILPDIELSDGSGPAKVKPRVTRYDFGDGYTQRVTNGLNPIKEEYSAMWSYLTPTDKETLKNFFVGLGGVTAFLFKPPLETEYKKYTCTEWQFTPKAGNWFSGTATFVEELDL